MTESIEGDDRLKQGLSVRAKSILGLAVVVIVLCSLQWLTLILLRGYTDHFSQMIDVAIEANDLRDLFGTATEGLPVEIEDFSLRPTAKNREKILAKFARIEERLQSLSRLIPGEELQLQLSLIRNMFESLRLKFHEIERLAEQDSAISEANLRVAEIKDSVPLVVEAIQQFISQELSYQQVVKSEYLSRTSSMSLILFMLITLATFLGFYAYYRFLILKSILRPLQNLQNTMSKIASDASDIRLRVPIESRDEIGRLGEYFNKMADAIQGYKEGLEHLVAQRTQQLAKTQSQLLHSSKMSALGEMAGGIAHEVNTPLSVILTSACQIQDMTVANPIEVERVSKIAKRIETTAIRIGKIVHGLRTFSRDAADDAAVLVLVSEVIEDTLALCSENFRNHGVQIKSELPLRPIQIVCRATEISQVLLNLLNNAYDAVRGLPTPWVEIQARVSEDEKWVEIRIRDSGSGIPSEIKSKIFQPFFTTKEIGKGTGLGLSISAGIVSSHGGQLSLDESGPHTCFLLTLPLTHQEL